MEHLLSTAHFFNSSWQSVERIPIVLSLLKDELNQLETAYSTGSLSPWTDLQKKLSRYQALHQHWSQMDLNPRQTEWVADMRLYLQTWQQMLSSLSQLPSPVLLPELDQKKFAPISSFSILTNHKRNKDHEIPKKIQCAL